MTRCDPKKWKKNKKQKKQSICKQVGGALGWEEGKYTGQGEGGRFSPLGAASHLLFPTGWTAFPRGLVSLQPQKQEGQAKLLGKRKASTQSHAGLSSLGLVAHKGNPGGREATAEGRLPLLEPLLSPSPGFRAPDPPACSLLDGWGHLVLNSRGALTSLEAPAGTTFSPSPGCASRGAGRPPESGGGQAWFGAQGSGPSPSHTPSTSAAREGERSPEERRARRPCPQTSGPHPRAQLRFGAEEEGGRGGCIESVRMTGKGENRKELQAGAHSLPLSSLDWSGTLQTRPWGWGGEGRNEGISPGSAEAKAPTRCAFLTQAEPRTGRCWAHSKGDGGRMQEVGGGHNRGGGLERAPLPFQREQTFGPEAAWRSERGKAERPTRHTLWMCDFFFLIEKINKITMMKPRRTGARVSQGRLLLYWLLCWPGLPKPGLPSVLEYSQPACSIVFFSFVSEALIKCVSSFVSLMLTFSMYSLNLCWVVLLIYFLV